MLKLAVVVLCLITGSLGAAVPDGMLPQLDGRIIGGSDTTITNYPFIVSVQERSRHICGGSLLNSKTIVTAAHCLQGSSASSIQIRAGSTNYNSGGTIVPAASITVHPNYNANTVENDVGIIKLKSALSLGSSIKTIALVKSDPADGTAANVIGWGTTKYGSPSLPTTLQHVDVNIISLERCSKGYSYGKDDLKETMICAGSSGKDACQGDSGGPLIVKDGLAGIVSWGYGCAEPSYPGVYASVAALRDWIEQNAA